MASKEDLEHFKRFIENYRRGKTIGAAGERWKEAQLRRYESYLRRGEVPPELLKVWHRKPKPVSLPVRGRLIPSARLRRDKAFVHGTGIPMLQRVHHNLKPAKPVLTNVPTPNRHEFREQAKHKWISGKVVLLFAGLLVLLKLFRR